MLDNTPCLIPLVAARGEGAAKTQRPAVGRLRSCGNSVGAVAVHARPPVLIRWQIGKQPAYLGHYFIE